MIHKCPYDETVGVLNQKFTRLFGDVLPRTALISGNYSIHLRVHTKQNETMDTVDVDLQIKVAQK